MIGGSVLSLLAWFTPVSMWWSSWGFGQTVKPITSVGLIIAGLIQLCSRLHGKFIVQLTAMILSWVLLLLMGVLAGCLLFGWCRPGLVGTPRPDAHDMGIPGHPSQATMLCFMLLAMYGQRRVANAKTVCLSRFTAAIVGFIGLCATTGMLFDVPSWAFFKDGVSSAMALPAAVSFLLLAIGVYRSK